MYIDEPQSNMVEKQSAAGMQLGQYMPPTRRQRLEQQKAQLHTALQKIDDALAALDSNPELEKFAETLSRAGV